MPTSITSDNYPNKRRRIIILIDAQLHPDCRATRSSIRFNMLNPATGNRIKMVSQDAETADPISRGDTVKGYEYQKGRYIVVTDEDMEAVRVESSTTMNVEKFVEADSLDPIYFDTSYYLVPDGKAGVDVYAVLREAIQQTGRLALARVVISQRERTIAIRPVSHGLVAMTLNEDRDLNPAASYFAEAADIKTDPEMVKLATQLIDRQTGRYEPGDIEDRYETRLRAMLDAKVKGGPLPEERMPDESNVVDLMAALKRSLLGSAPANDVGPVEKKAGKRTRAAAEPERRQPALKLPIEGGKKVAAAPKAVPAPIAEKAPNGKRRA